MYVYVGICMYIYIYIYIFKSWWTCRATSNLVWTRPHSAEMILEWLSHIHLSGFPCIWMVAPCFHDRFPEATLMKETNMSKGWEPAWCAWVCVCAHVFQWVLSKVSQIDVMIRVCGSISSADTASSDQVHLLGGRFSNSVAKPLFQMGVSWNGGTPSYPISSEFPF